MEISRQEKASWHTTDHSINSCEWMERISKRGWCMVSNITVMDKGICYAGDLRCLKPEILEIHLGCRLGIILHVEFLVQTLEITFQFRIHVWGNGTPHRLLVQMKTGRIFHWATWQCVSKSFIHTHPYVLINSLIWNLCVKKKIENNLNIQ